MRRFPVSKRRSARSFRKHVTRTRLINSSPVPNRGGFRL